MIRMPIDARATLPVDAPDATLIGRAWVPGEPSGPTLVTVRDGNLVAVQHLAPTVAALLEQHDAAARVRSTDGLSLGPLDDWLAMTRRYGNDPQHPHLLAPNDLQVVKAAGVTFATSMVERVIEEQARGDPARAESFRREAATLIGADLAAVVPGSPQALQLRELLMARGLWSQYLEVGIGVDAEIFTKAAPLASVGSEVPVGIHPRSSWNNPEPEVVLAVRPDGTVVGAALGNDVNLRDFEGRSALLLGKAKDNNGSCAIGPFIRLFDDRFGIDDVRNAEISLRVEGEDGFELRGASSMSKISRDPLDLVGHAMGRYHQYPDGIMLFCGTMFAPVQDRDAPGAGFTHHVGDRVVISSPKLGALVNLVQHCDQIPRWQFGVGALMRNLAQRGLL